MAPPPLLVEELLFEKVELEMLRVPVPLLKMAPPVPEELFVSVELEMFIAIHVCVSVYPTWLISPLERSSKRTPFVA